MPTIFTHAIVGLTASQLCLPKELEQNKRGRLSFTGLSIALPVLPDLDGLFLPVIPYAHPLGHRGLSHSVFFAIFLGVVGTVLIIRRAQELKERWVWLVTYFSVLTASHGLLDAMTTGGLGIALFAPFDNQRYFFSIRPILASPIWPSQFISRYGLKVMIMESLLIWTVCCALLVGRHKLMAVINLLRNGVTSLVRILEQRYRLTAVTLVLLAAIVWFVRSI